VCLNFESPEPLHVQLKLSLKESIFKNEYKKKIPSERELMKHYSVSRTTVRLAVSALVNEGILQKSHGKGAFIANSSVQDWLGSFRGFTETVKDTGMKPGSELLYSGKIEVSNSISLKLQTEEIYLIERLRFADDIPIAIEKNYYPINIGKQLEQYNLDTIILYDILEQELGINLWKADQKITSDVPLEKDAKLLDVHPASSVLISERVIYTPEEKPIEFLKSIFRPDMYSFNVQLMRGKQ